MRDLTLLRWDEEGKELYTNCAKAERGVCLLKKSASFQVYTHGLLKAPVSSLMAPVFPLLQCTETRRSKVAADPSAQRKNWDPPPATLHCSQSINLTIKQFKKKEHLNKKPCNRCSWLATKLTHKSPQWRLNGLQKFKLLILLIV